MHQSSLCIVLSVKAVPQGIHPPAGLGFRAVEAPALLLLLLSGRPRAASSEASGPAALGARRDHAAACGRGGSFGSPQPSGRPAAAAGGSSVAAWPAAAVTG